MLQKNSLIGRLAPRLVFQLVPAIVVSTAGIALLGSLARSPDPAPTAPVAETAAIQSEAVFTAIPRQTADVETDDADARRAKAAAPPRAAKPKTAAANPPAPQPQRKVAATEPAVPAPAELPAAPQPGASGPPPAAPASSSADNFIVSGWRRVTNAAERITQWAQPPSSWFERSPPPRPPAPIPERNFVNASLDQ